MDALIPEVVVCFAVVVVVLGETRKYDDSLRYQIDPFKIESLLYDLKKNCY